MGLDIAIDLGTSRTRIFLQNKGVVVDEPSVITINLEDDSVVAVGQEAYMMLGRTSSRISAMYPLSGGVISDFGLVEAMIGSMLKRVVSSKIGMPRAVACVPSEITEVEKRAVVNAISGAGIRRVCLIEEPVAAAIGAGLDINSPHGSFVVDIGGGTTDMAVISLSGIAVSRSIKQAGNVMDDEIIKYVKKKYNMLIGKRMAEDAKIKIGSVVPDSVSGTYRIKGRNLLTGMPMCVDITSDETVEPLKDIAAAIVRQVQDILEETPPELIGDIYSDGIVLTGAGSQLSGIDTLIRAATDLKVRVADEPDLCVIKGCGNAIKYIDALNKSDRGGINPISEQY
ncbi:MAG: rod shape-determining protein [Clostridia bacterium]|nr:rod shape-determining protein [Clostridia bacterium]